MMGKRHGLPLRMALLFALAPALACAQSLAPSGPPSLSARPSPVATGFLPLYRPQPMPDFGPAGPNADLAYAAYQRGYFRTALQEAMKRLDRNKADTAAMTLVGELFKEGFGVRRDLAEAARWFRLAAERGNVQAQFALAMASLSGTGVPQDRAAATALLEKAAAAGHAGALFNLGILAIDGEKQDFSRAADFFRRAAEGGNVDGAYSLALLYREGRGVMRDNAAAARWMKRAADERIAAAEVEYAIMLFNGEGVARDEAGAAKLFLRAAYRNNPVAMNRLARLYLAGRGIAKDEIEAMKWHILARAVGLNDDRLDAVLKGMNVRDMAIVEERVRQFIDP
jgi:TPR repeat protein